MRLAHTVYPAAYLFSNTTYRKRANTDIVLHLFIRYTQHICKYSLVQRNNTEHAIVYAMIHFYSFIQHIMMRYMFPISISCIRGSNVHTTTTTISYRLTYPIRILT